VGWSRDACHNLLKKLKISPLQPQYIFSLLLFVVNNTDQFTVNSESFSINTVFPLDLQGVGCGGMDWIELAQDRDRLAGTCESGNEPSGSIKCGEFLD
jgi:hypothetical protein